MVALDAAANPKIKRLKRKGGKEARWAFFHGVLPIAAKADMRGSFCVGSVPADVDDVVDVADVTLAEAKRMLDLVRELGMLERDEDGIEWVHDFEVYNPEPKKDPTAAKRARAYRERQRARRDGTVTSHRDGRDANAPVTPPEVEEEVEGSSLRSEHPRAARTIKFDKRVVPAEVLASAQHVVDVFNERAGTGYRPFTDDGKPSENLKRVLGAMIRDQRLTTEVAERMITRALGDPKPFWGTTTPHLGHVFGPGVVEANTERAVAAGTPNGALSAGDRMVLASRRRNDEAEKLA